jgi:hypothetical protein
VLILSVGSWNTATTHAHARLAEKRDLQQSGTGGRSVAQMVPSSP